MGTPAIYLVFIAVNGFVFAFSSQSYNSLYGPTSWILLLIFVYASPLASLFFTSLPPLVMLELMTVFVLVFLVIVPLCNPAGNLWNLIDETATEKGAYGRMPALANSIAPMILLCVLVVCLVVVSVIVDISNRQSFINKKIIEALTKQREKTLLQQKEEHENLIHSIFPPAVAKDLIRRQSSKSLSKVNSEMGCKSFGHKNFGHVSLSSLVAQMHQEVTILFTDIVGFTAMSQTVAPQQVMEFLHDLFVRFDELVGRDSLLWKVETIGDAFMVASGLDGVRTKSRELAISDPSSTGSSVCLCPATAAVLFGQSALVVARCQ